jgi:hypothetical protein
LHHQGLRLCSSPTGSHGGDRHYPRPPQWMMRLRAGRVGAGNGPPNYPRMTTEIQGRQGTSVPPRPPARCYARWVFDDDDAVPPAHSPALIVQAEDFSDVDGATSAGGRRQPQERKSCGQHAVRSIAQHTAVLFQACESPWRWSGGKDSNRKRHVVRQDAIPERMEHQRFGASFLSLSWPTGSEIARLYSHRARPIENKHPQQLH